MRVSRAVAALMVSWLAVSGVVAADGPDTPEEKVREIIDKLWCFGAPAIVGFKVDPNFQGPSLGNGKFLMEDTAKDAYGVFEDIGDGPGPVPGVVYAKYRVQGLAGFDSQKDFCQRGIMTPGHPLPF